MLIVNSAALRKVMEAIVAATHSIVDENGQKVTMSTIDSARLESAAIAAVITGAGQMVWPDNHPIDLPAPAQAPGPFRVRG